MEETSTVLDALIKIREEVDGSLALRCSCRSAICGSCAMRINHQATLACKTKLNELVRDGKTVTVEPVGNMATIKDLVADMSPHWQKIRQVTPWVQHEGPEPETEYLAPNEAMLHLTGVMACIQCGACVSDCTALEADANFIAPAALAKAYRFVADPRDTKKVERLGNLNKYGGIWDCTRCYYCVQVCPKGVAPMDRIMAMREMAIQAGYNKTYGARHTIYFGESVKHSGWLDELRLPVQTWGIFNLPKMLSLIPVGIRALLRGKMPPIFHHKRPHADQVRRIFERVESASKK